MTNKLTLSASPHITNKANSTKRIMLDVMVALMPCVIAATLFFGYHVIINVLVCVGACFGFELLFSLILKKDFSRKAVKESSCFDFSCIVTGIILALNLPAKTIVKGWNFNIYDKLAGSTAALGADNILLSFDSILICIVGSLFAIVLVKLLFGGIGKNFANPAATARIFLLLCFGLSVVNSTGSMGLAGSSGATWLSGNQLTNNQSMFWNMFIGNRGTSAVGETSMIAILLGFIYLSVRKVIDFRIPLIILGSAAVFFLLFDGLLTRHLTGARLLNNMYANLMGGGLAFAAVFMATDYSTSPNTFAGSAIFAVGIAFLTVIMRVYTSMPEGVSYALLLMNIVVPLIDKFIYPKPFGYSKKPKPTLPNAAFDTAETKKERPNADFKTIAPTVKKQAEGVKND